MTGATPRRVRREPPPFRRVAVREVERLSPRMVRVLLGGDELAGLHVEQPAASVRLLLPDGDAGELVVPAWTGNEFLLPDGRRPTIRTFTPRPAGDGSLALDIVVHGPGRASTWATAAAPGDPAAVSGPGRGYEIDRDAPSFLLAGDETAIPAIGQLLEAIPAGTPVEVRIEVAAPEARVRLPDHPRASVTWHALDPGARPGDALATAVEETDLAPQGRVWVAGEAAAVQRIRKHLFQERGLDRARATVRGYWQHGRAEGTDDAP